MKSRLLNLALILLSLNAGLDVASWIYQVRDRRAAAELLQGMVKDGVRVSVYECHRFRDTAVCDLKFTDASGQSERHSLPVPLDD